MLSFGDVNDLHFNPMHILINKSTLALPLPPALIGSPVTPIVEAPAVSQLFLPEGLYLHCFLPHLDFLLGTSQSSVKISKVTIGFNVGFPLCHLGLVWSLFIQ